MVLSAFDDVGRLFDRGVDLIAIERPEGYAFKRDGKGANAVVAGLVGSSYVAGGIAWLARAEGFRVVELTANAARRTVLGKPSATDKHIKSMVPCLVYGWPKVSNPHQRDAAIVALAASWTTRERQVA
jgi:Holliday junction resolvasome RuvABC endonuclease subunit